MGNFSKLSPFYVVETGMIILRKRSKMKGRLNNYHIRKALLYSTNQLLRITKLVLFVLIPH